MTARPTILITGAAGFLGAHVLRAAAERGLRAIGAARAQPGPERAGEEWAEADLLEPGAGARLVVERAPELVVNAAALALVSACERDPAAARRLNAELPGELAEACARRGARLVHVSTDLVFGAGRPRGERYREDDGPAPLHEYGRTKAAGERAALVADPRACVARLPLLFGDSGGRGRGAGDSLLAALAHAERPLLFTDEHRTPLDVRCAARALVELALGAHAGLLHVAGPERVSRHALGLRLLRAAGVAEPERRVRAGVRADVGLADLRAADVSLDASLARSILATGLVGPP